MAKTLRPRGRGRGDLAFFCGLNGSHGIRGFSTGRLFTRDGRQVASVVQEGLLRRLVPEHASAHSLFQSSRDGVHE